MNPSAQPSNPAPEIAPDFLVRLRRHPQLYEQMAALLDEVENRAGALNTGDEADLSIDAPLVKEFPVGAGR